MVSLEIYLVDDDHDDRELFMEALNEIGTQAHVHQFENGVDLMAELFSKSPLPDVIFLDLYMPIMNGFDCLTDIRSFSEFTNIEVVVFSTSYRQREVDQLKMDGANQYIQKPVSFEELKNTLGLSLKIVEARKEEIRKRLPEFVIFE